MPTDAAGKAELWLKKAEEAEREGLPETARTNSLIGIGWSILALRKSVTYLRG